jgi:glycosyltransferase involved in cell wall biosynthesis
LHFPAVLRDSRKTELIQRMPGRAVVLMPVRDDWQSAVELIRRIDQSIDPAQWDLEILLVDDGSIQTYEPAAFVSAFSAVRSIRILRLRRNLGHQRAIAIGLVHIHQTNDRNGVVVMDADGEDTPEGLALLLDTFTKTGGIEAVFAERVRRSESLSFQFFYQVYRFVHRGLTGITVRVGNFSILPPRHLETLVVLPELWNHYAAAVFRSRLPIGMIPIPRGHRIAGKSKMNFVALVMHGLSAVSVFGDTVGVRLLIGSLLGSLLAGLGIIAVVFIRFFTDLAIPGWATYAIGVLAVVMIQMLTIAASFTFFTLSSRANPGFLPLRDCSIFVAESVDVYCRE